MTGKMGLRLMLAVAALALGAGPAAAIEGIAFRPGGEISMSGPVTFTAGETTIRCNVLMHGTLERSYVQTTEGNSIGGISSAQASECSGGRVTFLVPTSIDFVRLLVRSGTEQIIGVLVRFRNFGVLMEEVLGLKRCLFGPRVELLIGIERVREPGGEYVTLEVTYLTGSVIELFRQLGLSGCPLTATAAGTMALRPQQTVATL